MQAVIKDDELWEDTGVGKEGKNAITIRKQIEINAPTAPVSRDNL